MKIGYCRVSTDGQDLDAQILELQKFGCEKIYSDIASGVKKRPELDKLLNFILREGDTFVVFRLDRVGRSLIDLLNIIQLLSDKKIHFVSISEKIDTETPQGKLLFSISGAFAEYERSIIQERTKAGLKNAVAKGKILGRPKGIKNFDIALTAYDLRERKNKSPKEIAEILKIGIATVYRYLKVATDYYNSQLDFELTLTDIEYERQEE